MTESPVLSAMLSSGMVESRRGEVVISGVADVTFDRLVKFLSIGQLPEQFESGDELVELHALADRFLSI